MLNISETECTLVLYLLYHKWRVLFYLFKIYMGYRNSESCMECIKRKNANMYSKIWITKFLKVHKREKFFGSDFEIFTIL
jgi:hypothetical protein